MTRVPDPPGWDKLFPGIPAREWWRWHPLWTLVKSKPCIGCGRVLLLAEFWEQESGWMGRMAQCTRCVNAAERRLYRRKYERGGFMRLERGSVAPVAQR